jgi:phosphoribosyl 1,2-cyclic phosphodiesterase
MTERSTALFYPISSGSCGNAIFVRCGTVSFLIDCGIASCRIRQGLDAIGEDPSNLAFILVTHAHADHTSGIGVMARKYKTPIYASNGTWKGMRQDTRLGVIPLECQCSFYGDPEINELPQNAKITAFSTPHDSPDSVGYRIEYEGRTAAVATDLGYVSMEVRSALRGADLVLLESNHDLDMLLNGYYPQKLKNRVSGSRGHLSNSDAGRLAAELVSRGTKLIYLGHLSHENNTPQLAMETVQCELFRAGIDPKNDVRLLLARRNEPSEAVYW